MKNTLCQYCDKHCFLQFDEDIFGAWLVDLLGPVMLGVKPAEILSFSADDLNREHKIECIEKAMEICICMSRYRFTPDDGSIKYIFYKPKAMFEALIQPNVKQLLYHLGYPSIHSEADLVLALHTLGTRFTKNGMPHEIGVFLGYPIKDVLAFMGLIALPLTKTQGWKVYGDARISDKKYSDFVNARYTIRNRLQSDNWLRIIQSA